MVAVSMLHIRNVCNLTIHMTTQEPQKDSTENCYLTYTDELEGGGYLTCIYNHKIGERCLLDRYDDPYAK